MCSQNRYSKRGTTPQYNNKITYLVQLCNYPASRRWTLTVGNEPRTDFDKRRKKPGRIRRWEGIRASPPPGPSFVPRNQSGATMYDHLFPRTKINASFWDVGYCVQVQATVELLHQRWQERQRGMRILKRPQLSLKKVRCLQVLCVSTWPHNIYENEPPRFSFKRLSQY